MLGIVGVISPSSDSKETLHAMLSRMTHGPLSVTGKYVNPEFGLWSGWIRHEGDLSERMPIWNKQRDVCLIFSGEEFIEREQSSPSFNGKHVSNLEYGRDLVESYERTGAGFLEKINGSFSGLLLDLRQNKLLLFNDRYGLNRIYFHESEKGFYFASEAKSLLKVLPELRQIDIKGLGEFFSCGCVLQNRTLFAGISLLPPASVWTFTPGKPLRKETYFQSATWENQTQLNATEYYEELKATWCRILPRYFRGATTVAVSLTGGVDSRMILAWVPGSALEVSCYTFGGRYRDCADVTISRRLAEVCGRKHEVISVGQEFLSRFPDLAAKAVYLSDGACDVTGSIDLYVMEVARRIAPVRVTGTNGGEILRRLLAFKPAALDGQVLSRELAQSIDFAQQTYARELQGHRLSFTAFKQAPWYMGSKFILERSMLDLRMPYFDNDLVALAYRTPVELLEDNTVSLRLAEQGNPALSGLPTDRGVAKRRVPGIGRTRHLFGEFTFKAEYAFDYGMPQWLVTLDRALAPLHLERLFLGRHKFAHFRIYYRDELSNYIKEILLDPRARNRPYLNGTNLERMVTRHVEGSGNYTREIHKLLSAELVMRQLIEQN